jgi:hypothetical protein
MAGERLTRKVQFYRLRPAEPDEQLPPLRAEHLAMISRHEQAGTAHFASEDGRVLLGRALHNDSRLSMALYLIRYDELPARERQGKVEALNLADDEGLAEPIHVVFHSGYVIGVLYNHYGPRPSRLADYLNNKCGLSVAVEPIIRLDGVSILDRFTDVRRVHLRINDEHLGELQPEQRLFDSAHALSLLGGGPVEVALAFAPAAREGATDMWKALLGRLLSGPARASVERAKVWGYDPETGRVESLDLLSHRIEVEREVERARERGRVVADHAAVTAILDAYQLVESEIRKAMSHDSAEIDGD